MTTECIGSYQENELLVCNGLTTARAVKHLISCDMHGPGLILWREGSIDFMESQYFIVNSRV